MSQNNKNLYEAMFVMNSALTEELRSKVFDKVLGQITSRGGEILKIHDQGRKRLAYEIQGHKEGQYYVVFFEAPPTAITEVRDEYRLIGDLIRYIFLRADEVKEKIEFKALAE